MKASAPLIPTLVIALGFGSLAPHSATAQQQPAATSAAERLPTLQAQFDNRVRAEVEEPYQKGLAELNTKYAQALNQAFQDAQKAGNLAETLAAKEELLRVTKNEPLPKEDPADFPANLKRLRTAYRQSHDLIAVRRAEGLAKWQGLYAGELQKMVAELTRMGKLEDAVAVQERIKALGVSATVAPTGNPAPPSALPPALAATTNDPSRATKDSHFVNTLGMRFVPVPDTDSLFCIHEVRYKDYATYALDAQSVDGSWKDQSADGYNPTDRSEDHPVVRVSWEDAQKFCSWLSNKEGKTYRLPTDREWSIAVGIGREEDWKEDTTPATVFKPQDAFPWGKGWPPPKGAGNYSDESRRAKTINAPTQYLNGYDDGYPTTAPVMQFKPNKLGIYDMGGNVWEWVEDWHSVERKEHGLRGGSWRHYEQGYLLSSSRNRNTPTYRFYNSGFRVVLSTSDVAR